MLLGQSLARLEPPIYSTAELVRGVARLDALPGFRTDIFTHAFPLPDGRLAVEHMWVYPALVAPGIAAASAIELHPNYAFALFNLVLFLGAAWQIARRAGTLIAALLALSVLVWWLDKAHTEIFTFSLLAVAVITLRDRPVWAMAALGLVAAQNIAAGPLVPLAAAVLFAHRRSLTDAQIWIGLACGLAIAAIHVVWHVLISGAPTAPIIEGGGFHFPTLAEATSFLLDTNMGLLPHAPLVVLVVVVSAVGLLVHARQRLTNPAIVFAASAVIILVVAFSQTNNIHAGGTVGPHRYALWFMPLAIPLLQEARSAVPRVFAVAALPAVVLSCVISVLFYAPARPEGWLRPTWLADAVWRHVPVLDNPLPEVFYERVGQRESAAIAPIAFGGCSKILVVDGRLPDECSVDVTLPQHCLEAACYANRTGTGYTVTVAPLRGSTTR
jgi:hypothetical protein